MLGADADGGRLDARGGRWATLILTEPLLPGTGAGNNLKWSDLGRSAPGNRAEFSSAAAQAFREYVQLNSPALRIDPGELGASGKTTVLRGGALVQIQVPREYDGIPVRDSYLHAVINHGNLVLFGTSKWGDINLSTSPDVFFDDALAVVQAQVEPYTIDGFWGNSGLFIVPLAQGSDVNQIGVDLGYTHRLAWMMRPVFQGEPGNYEALVDAHSGELLSFGDTNDTTQNTSESVAGLISAVAGIAEAQLESGSVSVGGTAVTVNLTNTYATPVVVTTLQYSSSTTPAVTRVSNVTSSSFDVRLQNPSGGSVATENVSYLVVEEGTWTVDGHLVEAQIYTSTVTDEDGSWVGEVQGYNQSYTNPVVLGQVMSENDAGFSVFWDQGSVRENPPSATDLTTGKTVAEDTTVARLDETVGFIVFEKGNGTIGGVAFEAALGADTVGGVGDSPPYTYTFNTPFGSSPSVALLTMAGVDGFNGAWAQVHGATLATTTSLFLSVDEDQILDAERAHTTEQVGYVVFEGPVVFPPCENDGDCSDGIFCNGAEACVDGACQAGTPVDCDDGVGCTDDSCDEGADSCGNVANNGLCDDGAFCNGSETCDINNDCQAGSAACEGQSCDEGTDTCSGAAQIEWGSVSSMGGSAVTVNLTNTYVSAVVVTTLQYSSSTNPTVTRVSNVTATSFDVRLPNPSGTAVATENVSYVVVEEGFWTINGVAVEAQTYTSTVTDNDASWVGQVQSYLQSYTNPVVLGQVMTENDADFSVFWDQGVLRTDPPAAALTTGKTVAEDSDLVRLDETVGFIVFEAAHGTMGGVEFEAALGAGIVEGVDNSPPFTYTFNTPFALSPSIAVLTMAGVDGFNGGWAQVHGATLADTTSLFLSVDEDQIADTERAHAAEQVGYLVFQAAGSFMYLP